jgi:hypothetical protein
MLALERRSVAVLQTSGPADSRPALLVVNAHRESSTILSQNVSTSSGFRLVTWPASTCRSSSTQLPPALRMSVCRLGHEVNVRPSSTPASISIHGA